jgi:hypothetical protein
MPFLKRQVLLMTLIWNTVTVPTEWLHATITCLFKKGIRKLAANYRGISIGANMSRILEKIIILRLKEAYEKSISEAQFGFRQNRSTNDGIFVVRNIIQKYNDTLIAVYIDLTAAYDHVPRKCMRTLLQAYVERKPNLIFLLVADKEDKNHHVYSTTTLIMY